tara:strand:+ start:4045 stop:4335 length:291 start_codon:yes stop_codon:yes gene_type:complete
MDKELLKQVILETLKEELGAQPEEAPEEEGAGITTSEMREELISLAKDSRTISSIAAPERQVIVAAIKEMMQLAVQKNITSGNVATLLNKLFALNN